MKKISLKRVIKKIFNRTGVTIMASVFLCAIGIGGGFGIAKLVRPQTIADETITLPDGSAIPTVIETPSSSWIPTSVSESGLDWEGSGTASSPYLISSVEDFAKIISIEYYSGTTHETLMKNYINGKYFKVTCDLDFSGKKWLNSASSSGKAFKDFHFDGGGHTFSNIYGGNTGLFNYFGKSSEIYDFVITNSYFNMSSSYGGGICRYASYILAYDITIENTYFSRASSDNIAGFGTVYYSYLKNVNVEDCYIEGRGTSAGLVNGYNNCLVNCNSINNYITATSGRASGVVDADNLQTLLLNCHNSSTVIGSSGKAIGIGYGATYIIHCSNTGDITGSSDAYGIGGSGSSNYSYCWNTGNITAGSTASGISVYGENFINCYNTGTISSSHSATGIVYQVSSSTSTMSNCYNIGSITAGYSTTSTWLNAGGIAGDVYGLMYNCLNSSTIESTLSSYVGGIVGQLRVRSSLHSCVYDTDKFDQSSYTFRNQGSIDENSGGVEGLEAKLKSVDEMTGNGSLVWNDAYPWDFENVWAIDETGTINNGYPYIIYEYKTDTVLMLNGENISNQERKDWFVIDHIDTVSDVEIHWRSKSTLTSEFGDWNTVADCLRVDNDGIYEIYATYLDENSAEQTTSTYTIKKDNVAPVVDFGTDALATVIGGKYIRYTDFSFTVSDSLSDDFTIKYRHDTTSSAVVLEASENVLINGNTVTIKGVPENEGSWYFSVSDGSGNSKQCNVVLLLDVWANSDYTTTPTGEGTATNPYKISSGGELGWFVQNIHSDYIYLELTQDISLSAHEWAPIMLFKGELNGNGHKITGIYNRELDKNSGYGYEYQGLFGYSDNDITIKNLSIYGTITGRMYCSALVGYLKDSSLVMENCHNYCNVSAESHCGGLVGIVEMRSSQNANISIENCVNYGDITASGSYLGGAIGRLYVDSGNNVSFKMSNCYNLGDISSSTNRSHIGGCIGYLDFCPGSGTCIIENCYNEGNITGGYYIGGLVGSIHVYYSPNITLRNNFVRGTLTYSYTSSYTNGAFVGNINGSTTSANFSFLIENCSIDVDFYMKGLSTYSNVYNIIGGTVSSLEKVEIKNTAYDVVIHYGYSSSTGTYSSDNSSDPTHKGYYDDGDDTVDTDFSEWFIHENFNEGKPSLRGLYWIGANFEEQDIKSKLDDLGYLDLNHQDSSEEVA